MAQIFILPYHLSPFTTEYKQFTINGATYTKPQYSLGTHFAHIKNIEEEYIWSSLKG